MNEGPASGGQDCRTLWVGTYAAKGGSGLCPLSCSPSGEWTSGHEFQGAQNASFAAWSERHQLHYLVDEQKGMVAAYRLDQDGWFLVAEAPAGGSQPCYVALDHDQRRLAVANYGSGSIALFSLGLDTGVPDDPPDVSRNSGHGPNQERQESPHAHCAYFSPDQRWLYQVDLGTDEILAFPLRPGLGEPRCAYRAPPGSGPRHLLFHPKGRLAFLISELGSTVDLLQCNEPSLSSVQRLSTIPDGFGGQNLGGHLGINAAADRVYVTNRGHDSIATFAFDGERLALLQHVPCGGVSPRHFLLLEEQRLMLVANEESGNVTGFHVDSEGMLRPAGIDIRVAGAAFLLRGQDGPAA